MKVRYWLLAASLLVASAANAHYPGESYIYLNVAEDGLSGRFEITLDDIGKAVALDGNGDGTLSEDEFTARAAAVYAYLQPRLLFYHGAAAHSVTVTGHRFLPLPSGTFAQIEFQVPGLGAPPDSLEVAYQVPLDGIDGAHKARLLIENNVRTGVQGNESVHALVLAQGAPRQRFSLVGEPWHEVMGRFIAEGAWHIWIGFDHILFLVALLLVAVMVRDGRNGSQWAPVSSFRSALTYLVKVVTMFTVAHSITLCLAALHILRLPVTPVEVIIALSIAVAALNNIYPLLEGRIWIIVFGFGLIHGFGFANVLAPLGLSQGSLGVALAGFNIGVELGQITIVLVLFPVLYMLRNWRGYQPLVIRGGSVALILIAMFWVAERSLSWLLKQDFMTAMLNGAAGSA